MSGGASSSSDRGAALAAWLALTAPGALVTCAVITLALVGAHRYMPWIVISPAVRQAAVALLIVHVVVTIAVVLWPGRWWTAFLFLGLLAADALLCGMLVGAEGRGPAALLAFGVLVISLEVGGWLGAALSVVAVSSGAVAAIWWGIGCPLVLPAALSFPTALAVETSFAGGAMLSAPVASFPTTLSVETSIVGVPGVTFPTGLSVETWMAGMPAFASPGELFIPVLSVVLAALCLGLTTSMWRVRRARTAVAASIVSAARVLP